MGQRDHARYLVENGQAGASPGQGRQQSSTACFERSLLEVEHAMRSHARRLIGPSLQGLMDEDDLVQLVYLALWRGARNGRYRLEGTLHVERLAFSLMGRIAATLGRRERKLRTKRQHRMPCEPATLEPAAEDRLASAEATEIVARLRSYFDEASWRYMQLRFVEGYSAPQVAEQVGFTAKAIQKRIARRRAALPEQLVELAVSCLGRARGSLGPMCGRDWGSGGGETFREPLLWRARVASLMRAPPVLVAVECAACAPRRAEEMKLCSLA